jgi:PAS domain S-box-containing protein
MLKHTAVSPFAAVTPGSGLGVGDRESALLAAALAVNDAAGLDAALQILADAALTMVSADSVALVVWNDQAAQDVVRTGAGDAAGLVGAQLVSDTPSSIAVPLEAEGRALMTFHAAWGAVQDAAALELASTTLATLGALTGIAYRTERERERARERARLGAVLDAVADGIWLDGGSGVTANAAARRLLAIPHGVEPTLRMFDPRELDGSALSAELAPAPGESLKFRHRVVRCDGVERILDGSVSAIASAAGGPAGVVGIFRDVTEEHNKEFLTQRFLERLFEEMPTAVAVLDPTTDELLSVNRAMCELVGTRAEEILGRRPPQPWGISETPEASPGPAGDGAPQRVQSLLRHAGGLVPVEIVRFLVRDAAGEPVARVALVTDVSERRRFEQQLVQSGKLATIGELAAGVAHEINNPLFAILGLVEFLLKDAEPGTKAHERMTLIQETGLEIKEIVRALLDFAREPSEDRTVLSLRAVAEQTVELVRRTSAVKSVEIVEAYADERALVDASSSQLKQIMLNLLSNATHAMPDGGVITVGLEREGETVVVTISDTGPGIAADVLPLIFEPFFTTKRALGGTGLGLAVSLGIAHVHGGELDVSSTEGQGTTFRLVLPAYVEEAA